MEVKHRMMGKLMILVATFLGGFAFVYDNVFADAGLDFSVNVSDTPILEINLSDANGSAIGATTTMDVVPDHGAAAFNEKTMVVSVGTNNEWGYNLVMSVSNTSLVSTEDGSKTIPTLTSKDGGYTCTVDTASSCDFTANTWGYKLNAATNLSAATNYLPLQSSINLNSNTGRVTTLESTSISFGSRINATLAPGTYQTTINFAATANPDLTPIMQNVSASDLASLTSSNGTVTLKDERDGTKYTIGKLADGNYWMLDNLALDLTNSTTLNSTTASNTNASDASITSLKSGNRTAGDQYATAGVSNWTSSYSYSAPLVNAASKDQTQPLAAGQSGTGKIGVYYNYCAASAGSYCYGNGTDKGSPSGNATEDICPKGWRMPTGGSSGEYKALYTAYSSNKADFVNALKAPLSGRFLNGSAGYQGSNGYFWSSTYSSASNMYYLGVYTSNVYPQSNTGRGYGHSIRCVYDIPTMQSMTSSTLAEKIPTSGSTTVLKDSRDGNNYQITNVNGAYWMTDNLKIMGTISASESNFTGADFNISAGGDLTAGNKFTEPRAHFNTSDTNSATYGAYYNYCAASAGTVCSETKQDATSDICPKGWRLPTQTEITTIKNNNVTNFNPVLAGSYFGGSLDYVGSDGYWWLATAGDTYSQYNLYYNGSSWSVFNSDKHNGYSVRCVYGPLPTMQNVDSAKLASLVPNAGDTITLPDERDNTTYTVGRLADGKVWMLDNLALDLTNSTTLNNTTASNTNASDASITSLKSGNRTAGDQYATAAVGNLTSGNNYSVPLVNAASKDQTQPLAVGQSGTGKIGVYYNYCAASAGSYCYGNGTSAGSSATGDALEDICPKGWRMPTGGSSGEYQALYTAYSSNNANFVNALKTPLSGYFNSGSARDQGSVGCFWSSTYESAAGMYYLGVETSGVYPQSGTLRYTGLSIRCLFGS